MEFPSSEAVKPYKQKFCHIVAYVNLLGGVGLVIGEQSMIIPLAIVHLLQAFIKNNPFPHDPVGAQATHDNKMRAWIVDMIIFFALIIAMLDKHPLAGDGTKSSKVQKEKLKKK